MSELLDKQLNAQKVFLGFKQPPASPQKCVMKMKETNKPRKNNVLVKLLLIGMEGGSLWGVCGKLV